MTAVTTTQVTASGFHLRDGRRPLGKSSSISATAPAGKMVLVTQLSTQIAQIPAGAPRWVTKAKWAYPSATPQTPPTTAMKRNSQPTGFRRCRVATSVPRMPNAIGTSKDGSSALKSPWNVGALAIASAMLAALVSRANTPVVTASARRPTPREPAALMLTPSPCDMRRPASRDP